MKKKYKTKFPMARIKKIMQKDEDVGKIALATPILISKCLELFLQDLLDRTSEVARERNGRIISSAHLKQCIDREANFDFLKDIVEKVQNIESAEPVKKQEKRGRPRKNSLNASTTSTGSAKPSKARKAKPAPKDEEDEEEEDEEEEDDDEDDETPTTNSKEATSTSSKEHFPLRSSLAGMPEQKPLSSSFASLSSSYASFLPIPVKKVEENYEEDEDEPPAPAAVVIHTTSVFQSPPVFVKNETSPHKGKMADILNSSGGEASYDFSNFVVVRAPPSESAH